MRSYEIKNRARLVKTVNSLGATRAHGPSPSAILTEDSRYRLRHRSVVERRLNVQSGPREPW